MGTPRGKNSGWPEDRLDGAESKLQIFLKYGSINYIFFVGHLLHLLTPTKMMRINRSSGASAEFPAGSDANVTACVKAFLPPAVPSSVFYMSFSSFSSFLSFFGVKHWRGSLGNEFVARVSWLKITQLQRLAGNQGPNKGCSICPATLVLFFAK